MKAKNKKNILGFVICGIQLIVTIAFIVSVIMLGILPIKYVVIIGIVLLIFLALPFLNQLLCKKHLIPGRVLSIAMSIVILAGSVYTTKAYSLFDKISNNNSKIDKMVVAVLKDDPAEKLKDAKSYDFGVQYAIKSEDTKDVVDNINHKLKTTIQTHEFANLNDQVKGLYDKDVDAIIYNDAYTSVISESYEGFKEDIKIIFSYEIVNRLEETVTDSELDNILEEPFTIYLSGIDVEGSINTTGRSDVNILATVNPKTHEILLVTTPRDYYIVLPGISNGREDKLTHAGIYGVQASIDALANLYEVDVDYYARVNFTSLPHIVDALGGIDVESEYEFDTHPFSGEVMHVNKGINHFNGAQALVFCRERQNVPGGDFQRGRDQEAVITAMLKRAVSPAILTGALDIFDSLNDNIDTNMPPKQIKGFIKKQIAEPSSWNITSMSADGTPNMRITYSIPGVELSVCDPDYTSVNEIISAIDKVLAGEKLSGSELIEDQKSSGE